MSSALPESNPSTKGASIRIDGSITDPCSVVAGSPTSIPSDVEIEFSIAKKILLHELEQSGVEMDETRLRHFVANDIRDEEARNGYLVIARHIVSPLPKLKRVLGLFQIGGPHRHTLTPKWIWTETSDVQLMEDWIVAKGRARKA